MEYRGAIEPLYSTKEGYISTKEYIAPLYRGYILFCGNYMEYRGSIAPLYSTKEGYISTKEYII